MSEVLFESSEVSWGIGFENPMSSMILFLNHSLSQHYSIVISVTKYRIKDSYPMSSGGQGEASGWSEED